MNIIPAITVILILTSITSTTLIIAIGWPCHREMPPNILQQFILQPEPPTLDLSPACEACRVYIVDIRDHGKEWPLLREGYTGTIGVIMDKKMETTTY